MPLSLSALVLKDGNTALHNAAQKGHLKVVEILLDHGANIEATNKVINQNIFSLTYVYILLHVLQINNLTGSLVAILS